MDIFNLWFARMHFPLPLTRCWKERNKTLQHHIRRHNTYIFRSGSSSIIIYFVHTIHTYIHIYCKSFYILQSCLVNISILNKNIWTFCSKKLKIRLVYIYIYVYMYVYSIVWTKWIIEELPLLKFTTENISHYSCCMPN